MAAFSSFHCTSLRSHELRGFCSLKVKAMVFRHFDETSVGPLSSHPTLMS